MTEPEKSPFFPKGVEWLVESVLRFVRGSRVEIEAGAEIEIKGTLLTGGLLLTDTVWDDLRFPATGINPPGAASDPTRDTTDGRLVFSASQVNIIAIQVQMPHAWKAGSAIRPHVHWSPPDANAGNVKFEMKYKVANINYAFPGSWTTVTAIAAAGEVADKHEITGLGEIDMTGKTLSCMILMLVSRLGNDVQDTYASTIKLNEVDVHFEIDGLGSAEELIK